MAGAVAIGVTGCGSGSDSAKQADSVGQAAAGVGTDNSGTTSSAPQAATTSTAGLSSTSSTTGSSGSSTPSGSSTSASAPGSPTAITPASTGGSPATSGGNTNAALPTTTAPPTPHQTTSPKLNPPAAKPPAPKPSGGWLSGVPHGQNTPGPLDPRCMTGRVVCIDMSTRTLLWVVDGKPQYGMDVRFGDENNPTRKGKFDIYMKMKDCVSTIYHTPMPDAMFFSGGEAVHFSIDFATYGYAHHSHGCVNVRDRAAVERLFADTRVGDTVVVY